MKSTIAVSVWLKSQYVNWPLPVHVACTARRFAVPGHGSAPKVAAVIGITQLGLPTQAAVATATLDGAWHEPCLSELHMPEGVP